MTMQYRSSFEAEQGSKRSNLIIQAKKSNKRGQLLFALKEKYENTSSLKIKILNALTNKIH